MLYQACQERWQAFKADQSGATAIEYALIAGGLAVAVFIAVGTLAPQITTYWNAVAVKFASLVAAFGI